MLTVRTQRPFFKSRPGGWLLFAAGSVALVTLCLPYSPFAKTLEFTPPTPAMLGIIAMIALLYGSTMEVMKRIYYRRRSTYRTAPTPN